MRRILVVALAVLVPIVGVLVWREATDDDVDFSPIFNCEGRRVVTPPQVVERDLARPVRLEQVSDLERVIAMVPWRDGYLLAQRTGEILSVDAGFGRPTEQADVGERLGFGPEGGLLSVAVAPDGRHAYAHYTDKDITSHVVEWRIEGDRLVLDSERELYEVDHPHGIHIGGQLVFGPDGYLYLGFGDGGDTPSDEKRVRDLGEPDGKILRIDPTPVGDLAFATPFDNPFVGDDDARPDVWAYGLRNPWRFTFDRETGELWIADVGSNCWEEIDVVPAGTSGVDFGYGNFEAFHEFLRDTRDGSTFPLYAYDHDAGCAVIGGYVYRGSLAPQLEGSFLFADFCRPGIKFVRREGDRVVLGDLGVDVAGVFSFAEDADGEVYLLSSGAGIYRIESAE